MSTAMPSPGRMPVLLIEDEPSVMAYVRAALERGGYSLAPAALPTTDRCRCRRLRTARRAAGWP